MTRNGVTKLEFYSTPWLLEVVHGAEENSECLVFVSERVAGTLSTILSSQHHGARDYTTGKHLTKTLDN